jgi:hypothetical protein
MMSRPVEVSPVKAIFAGFHPEALHHVHHAAGQDVGDELHQRHDGHRRLLGRLEHHAVPGGERGRQLPHRHQEREVPGDDLAHDAEGLLEVVGHGVVVQLRDVPLLRPQAAREIAEVVHRQRQVGGPGLADRLPVVERLEEGERLEVGFHPVGDAIEDVGPVGGRRSVPADRRRMGRVERLVHVLVGAAGDLAQRLAGDRRQVDEVLTARRRDELAGDPVVVPRAKWDGRLERRRGAGQGAELGQADRCHRGCSGMGTWAA